jgi:hypothetical protein
VEVVCEPRRDREGLAAKPFQRFYFMPRRSDNLLIFAAALERPRNYGSEQTSGRTLREVRRLAPEDKRRARLPALVARVIYKVMKAVVPCLVIGSSLISTALAVVLILVN